MGRIKSKEGKMARWLLLAVALCALATVADAGQCSSSESKTTSECLAKATMPTDGNFDSVCKFYQDNFKCYPSCICNDDHGKAAYDAAEKSANKVLKGMDSSKTCTLKCGSAAGLRAGAVTTLLVAAFALLTGQ